MYKLLISDFENTLIDEEDAIPLSTMLALDRLRSLNIEYGVLSEKPFKEVLDYNKDFPFVDYIIALNGAYVYDVNKEKVIYKKNIGISIVKKIKKVFDKYNLCFYTLDWCNYTKDAVAGENVRKIGDFKVFSTFHKDNIFKIEIRCSSKKEQTTIISMLEELNLDINNYPRKDKDYYVEIVMKDSNRLNAIEKICKAKKISLEDTIVIGNNNEDIDLFKNAGIAITASSASTKLKKVSSKILNVDYSKPVEKVINEYFK